MFEIPENCKFIVEGADQVKFATQTNGDTITIRGINLDANDGGALGYLINLDVPLEIRIRIAPE